MFISTTYCFIILSITSSITPSTMVLSFNIFSCSSGVIFLLFPVKSGIALISPDSAFIFPKRWSSVNTMSPVRTAYISFPYLTPTLFKAVFSSNFPNSILFVFIKSAGIEGISKFPSTVKVPPLYPPSSLFTVNFLLSIPISAFTLSTSVRPSFVL